MKTTVCLSALLLANLTYAQTFTWESLPTGNFSSISETVDGVTATITGASGSMTIYDWSTGPFSGEMAVFGTRSAAGGQATGGYGPIRIDFSVQLSTLTVWFGDGPDDDDGLVTISAYSADGSLLDQQSYAYYTTQGPRSLTLTGAGISYITGGTSNSSTPAPDTITYDNITVTPVPEPASLLLLTPMLLLARRRCH